MYCDHTEGQARSNIQNALIPSFALGGVAVGGQFPLNMVLGWPKSWYEHFVEQKMFALAQK
jgi:hypothetical protein